METFGEHASMAERRADDATRDVMAWLKCEFLSDHVGEEYDGVIAAVVGFGFFVELADIYIEGLVHVSTLNGDYFQHDHAKHRLIGERTAISFRLGDEVRVKVMRVGMEDRKIDLELVSTPKRRQADRDALEVNSRGGRDGANSGKGGKKDGKAKGERSKRGSKSDKPAAGRGSRSAGPKPGRAKPAAGSARDQLAADAARAAGGKASASGGDVSGGELHKPRKRRPKSS
jgi:ribonuclease R